MRERFAKFINTWLGPDSILITCGLPASAKTGLAEAAQKLKGYQILSTDIIRQEVLKGEDVFDEKVASDMSKRQQVYDEVFRRAYEAAGRNKGVILDATFITQELRRSAADVAARKNRPFVIMQTSCSQEVSLARIGRRTKEGCESNAITEQSYLENKSKFEKVDLSDLKQLHPDLHILHFVVDTEDDLPEKWFVTEMNVK
jgi:predicted kinase